MVRAATAQDAYRLVIVGGGAAGVELAFATQYAFVTQQCRQAAVTLVASAHMILPRHAASVKARTLRLLQQLGIRLIQGQSMGAAGGIIFLDGSSLPADCLLAATGAQPLAWLRDTGLALDERGCVLVDAQHRSVSHPNVFAAGDMRMRNDISLPRSSVHAVFAGPVLAYKLLASIDGRALQRYLSPA
ncbi:MAG: FAD-dependent oxidoreductase [Acidocella sp.]|nr:FAD-dependent oxidoreductase [Acidocella sp.]